MRIIVTAALTFLTIMGYAQSSIDSCKIQPLHTASFAGIQAKGMISFDDISKLRKMISDEEGAKILRFTVSIDCDACEMYSREVQGDSLSVEDLQVMNKRESRYVISFECIVGQTKNGDAISHKPFLFYIKP